MTTIRDLENHFINDLAQNFGTEFANDCEVAITFREHTSWHCMFIAHVRLKRDIVRDREAFQRHLGMYQVADRLMTNGQFEIDGATYLIGDGDDSLAVTFNEMPDEAYVWVRYFS